MKPTDIQCTQVTPHHVELSFSLHPDLFWFQGHFPVQPILPGVTQLDWVMHFAQQYFTNEYQFKSIAQVKFQAPLLPNTQVLLSLIWLPEKELLQFSYQAKLNDTLKPISNGKIRLCR